MRHKILVICKEPALLPELKGSLEQTACEIHSVSSYPQAVSLISRFHYVMVIMDLGFSEANGVDVLRKLRQLHQTPILVLSGHATRAEEIESLREGADYYLPIEKPLDTERCLTYAMAIMRRHLCTDQHQLASILISGSGLKININLRKAYLGGEDLHLTPKQFSLLNALVENMGRIVTKEELYQIAWDDDYDVNSDEALKYHIRELRKKLRTHGADGLIETAWGVGYQFHIDNSE